MQLMTEEVQARLPPIGSQDEVADPVVQVKFFNPVGSWTWYAYEYDPASGRFFGFVVGIEEELGSFYLAELQDYKGAFGLGIERDLGFRPTPLSKVMSGEVR